MEFKRNVFVMGLFGVDFTVMKGLLVRRQRVQLQQVEQVLQGVLRPVA